MLNNWLKNVQFRRRCVLCSCLHYERVDICPVCFTDLAWLEGAQCLSCALPVSHNTDLCGRCLVNPPFYDKTRAVFEYTGGVEWLIQQLKFHGKLIPGHILGQLIADQLTERLKSSSIELMIPVPLHTKRIRERGFNQTVELFRNLSRNLAIPMDVKSGERRVFTDKQSGLSAHQRQKNIKGAFHFRRVISAKRVVIVDDVMTTGSTVNELARLLKVQGVEYVEVWVCARTP